MEDDGEMVMNAICRQISEIMRLCRDHRQCVERATYLLMRVSARFPAAAPSQHEGEAPTLNEESSHSTSVFAKGK